MAMNHPFLLPLLQAEGKCHLNLHTIHPIRQERIGCISCTAYSTIIVQAQQAMDLRKVLQDLGYRRADLNQTDRWILSTSHTFFVSAIRSFTTLQRPFLIRMHNFCGMSSMFISSHASENVSSSAELFC